MQKMIYFETTPRNRKEVGLDGWMRNADRRTWVGVRSVPDMSSSNILETVEEMGK